jgi:hypothetical protein
VAVKFGSTQNYFYTIVRCRVVIFVPLLLILILFLIIVVVFHIIVVVVVTVVGVVVDLARNNLFNTLGFCRTLY